jgi:AcrR family transcriptional regulator
VDYVIDLGRRQRKRQAVHRNVLDAAQRLFAERGVSRTTVDEIAEAADVARQTVFNHFPYKEALALELGADNIQNVAERANALLEAGTPALEVLQRSARAFLDSSIEQGECAAIVARELLHPDPERATRAAERVPLNDLFEAIMIQAREEGEVRCDLPLDIVAKRVGAILTSIVAQAMTCDATDARLDLAVCFDVLFNGISERRN